MAIIAKRHTIREGKHLGKKFGDSFDVMSMASWATAFQARTSISSENIPCPILHGFRSAYVSSDESHATLPEVVVGTPSIKGEPLVAAFPGTVFSSLHHAGDNLELLTTGYTGQGDLMTPVFIMAFSATKTPHAMLSRSHSKLVVAMETGFPAPVDSIGVKTISRTVSSLWRLGREAIKSLSAAWANLWERRDTHTKYSITINQFCQAKRDEFGEPIIRKEMAIPSQANLQVGRCRDYWRGLVPLITSKSVPPSNRIRGEDIVQSLEKSRIRCTESEDTLTINNYYYAAFAVEDVITPMVKVSQIEAYTPELGYALAKQEDDDLAALIDDGTITNTVGTLATGLTYDNYVRADQYLQDAEAPDDDRVIIISHAEKANALKQDQFVNSQYVKLQGGTSNTGLLGGILGYPVFVTGNTNGTNAAGHDSVMMQKSAIFFAQQIAPKVNTFWDIDYYCAKVSALETYGLAINSAYVDHAVWLKGL